MLAIQDREKEVAPVEENLQSPPAGVRRLRRALYGERRLG